MAKTGCFVLAITAALACGQAARADFVLYDGALNTTPDAQGWLYLASPGSAATRTASGGVTVLDSTAASADMAGFFSTGHPLVGTLDRAAGFTVTFRLQLDRESHTSNDRAGFSVIALGSDSKGVVLGFWNNEVWAQKDSPIFTHGEGAAFDTTAALTDYALTISGNGYTLKAGAQTLLTGVVKDYSAFGAPYTQKSFLFFGDDTTSAAALTRIARVTLGAVPEPSAWVMTACGGLGLLASGTKFRLGFRAFKR